MSVKSERLCKSPSTKQLVTRPFSCQFHKKRFTITKTECMTSKLQNSNHKSTHVIQFAPGGDEIARVDDFDMPEHVKIVNPCYFIATRGNDTVWLMIEFACENVQNRHHGNYWQIHGSITQFPNMEIKKRTDSIFLSIYSA